MPRAAEDELMFVGGEAITWPAENEGDYWRALHRSVASLRVALRQFDERVGTVDGDRDLSPDGRQRRLAALGMKALKDVSELPDLQTARAYAEAKLKHLGKIMGLHRAAPAHVDSSVLAEVRSVIRDAPARERVAKVWALMGDPIVLAAVTGAPAMLSGLDDEGMSLVEARVVEKLYPVEASERTRVEQARRHLDLAVLRAEKLVMKCARLESGPTGEMRSLPPILPLRPPAPVLPFRATA